MIKFIFKSKLVSIFQILHKSESERIAQIVIFLAHSLDDKYFLDAADFWSLSAGLQVHTVTWVNKWEQTRVNLLVKSLIIKQ